MPYAIVIEASTNHSSLRSIHGAQVQAAFLNLIERADPELSRALHDRNVLRQYGLALMQPGLGQVARAGMPTVKLRVACLDDRIYPALLKLALTPETAGIRFGGTEFRLARLTVSDERRNTWVGYLSLEELTKSSPSESPFLEMEFATPTFFRQGDRDDPMPLPEHVFGSLAQRLATVFEGFPMPVDDFRKAIREQVTVTRFSGETQTVEIGDGLRKTGFVGQVTYRVHREDMARWCHILARAAFFCGVGAKTSRGLGCIRCKD